MQLDLLVSLGVALAIGLIVGLERGWRLSDEPEGSRVAGLRTFGLSGLLGGVAAAIADAVAAPAVLAAIFIPYAAILGWYHFREGQRRNSFSATGTIAGILVFALGAMAVVGDTAIAGAAGVLVACLLASRDLAHGLLQRLSWPEVRSILLLLAMSAIVLPILPNRSIDPWGGFNPFQVWLFTILVAALSFAGYVATRLIGSGRGTIVAGLLGALVSSTGVTMAFGRRATVDGHSILYAAGASLAAMVSVLRVCVVMLLVSPELFLAILAPAVAAAAVFGVAGAFLIRRDRNGVDLAAPVANPLEIGPVMLFAGIFATVSFVSAIAVFYLGSSGLLATSAVSAVLDVDAATLSAARLASGDLPLQSAAQAVAIALVSNGLGRVGVAAAVGPRSYWFPLLLITSAAIGAGLIAALAVGGVF